MTSAGFNRRMRKTACPVVWKGHGVQSPVSPSDQKKIIKKLRSMENPSARERAAIPRAGRGFCLAGPAEGATVARG